VSTLSLCGRRILTLTEAFSGLPDTRKGPAVKYVLSEIMILVICAIPCGANNRVEVADWCADRQEWLKERFVFTHVPPSHDTFGGLFSLPDATVFEAHFREWINALAGIVDPVAKGQDVQAGPATPPTPC